MKPLHYIFLSSILFTINVASQQATEVYLASLSMVNDSLNLGEISNISNNEGYDNQPSFYDNEHILFSSTRNGQTDIALYTIADGSTSWITDTPDGSEYSPLKIPGKEAVSAIRLDKDGLQRLYEYDVKTGKSKELLKDLKVGYHVWYSPDIIVSTVLVENRMDLVVSNLKDNSNYTVQKNVGRSLHRIPNTDLISYISKENIDTEIWTIKALNPVSGSVNLILNVLEKIEDITWLSNETLLISDYKRIAKYRPKSDTKISTFYRFSLAEISEISRLAVSPDGKHLAFVAQEAPNKIVQKQVEAYNAGDLDAFVNCYDQNVVVTRFPVDTLYVGHEKMRNNYSSLSPDNKVYDVEVVKRIVIGNKVIDQEKVSSNGKFQQMQVALYEVGNAIESMSFIFDKETESSPEGIVQEQLDAYNARDIDGFLATYSDAVKLYSFPHKLQTDGQEAMRKGYADFFESAPDLHCEIKNRMVIGNTVIDEEYVTANGNTFNAVAIYEVEDGKIARVTFVR
ncbi:nuclear transport factor 2 family protein [Maribacter aestuarii]|uniref:nuclear transport factor 2 family protein n=1 Tax=Maribacter aestuarii TaxID=1130723 RepID=UPI00248AEFB4|nr:nuclear transport factor 2 family protein [Maribacter aestuarii]